MFSAQHRKILVRAREIINDPARWTQGVNATSDANEEIDPCNPHAVAFCANGAMLRASSELNSSPDRLVGPLDEAAILLGYHDFVQVNDNFSHSKVLEMFDKAIALCEEDSSEPVL